MKFNTSLLLFPPKKSSASGLDLQYGCLMNESPLLSELTEASSGKCYVFPWYLC